MADAGFFKGTSADQDRRFSDKEQKLLRSMKFPSEFDRKVDMRKVNLNLIRPWIAKKVTELVGMDDEVVVEYAMGILEEEQTPDPKKMQINLTGFLTKDTPAFMTALWKLLLEAQEDITGIPRTFVEEKKEELRRARENDTRAFDERDRRVHLDEIRDEVAAVVEVEVEEDLKKTAVDAVETVAGAPEDVVVGVLLLADILVHRRVVDPALAQQIDLGHLVGTALVHEHRLVELLFQSVAGRLVNDPYLLLLHRGRLSTVDGLAHLR
ncbi:PWI domain-containing protein [Mycena floridula]|nr:PWI domain-containing protein [Mycena floridula]